MAEALGSRDPPAAAPRNPGGARSAAPTGGRPGARTSARRPGSRREGGSIRDEALHLLAGTQKMRRPRKLKGLIAVLHSHFSQKVPESELQRLVDELIAAGQLSEANGAITYHL
jgi:hypothetical protein